MQAYNYKIIREPVVDYKPSHASCPDEVAEYLYQLGLAEAEQEQFLILMLNTRNRVIGHHQVSKGLVDRSHVHPREVFKAAILANASKVILAHNHPTGDTNPSKQDLDSTENLIESGELIGIKVIDHLIVGYDLYLHKRNYTSLRLNGHI